MLQPLRAHRASLSMFMAVILAAWQITQPIQAATFYWDMNGTTAGAGGAAPVGSWDGTNLFFNTDAAGGAGTLAAIMTTGDTVIFAAGTDATGAYTTTVSGTQNIGGLTFEEGTVTLTGGTLNFGTVTGALSVGTGLSATINSILANTSGGLTKSGTGTLELSGVNTYSGITTVSAGTLKLTNASALGATGDLNHTIVGAGATLDLNGLSIAEQFGQTSATQTDGFVNATSILTNSSANAAAITGVIGFNGTGAFTVNGTGNISLTRVYRSTGSGDVTITKEGTNTLILEGTADNAAASVTVNGGVVQLNKGGSGVRSLGGATTTIGTLGTLRLTNGQANGDQIFQNVNVVNNGTFDLQGQNEGFNNLTGTGVVTNGATNDASVLTLGENNGTFIWGGVIQDGAGASTLALTKVGAGIMTITGTNIYTGPTQINGTGGGITLDFATAVGTTNLISSSSALTMNNTSFFRNQTLTLTGKASTVNSQTFNGTSITGNGTRHQIAATSGASGGTMNLSLGDLTLTNNPYVDFILPAAGSITTTTGDAILGPRVTVNNGANYAQILGGAIAVYNGSLVYQTGVNISALAGYDALDDLLVDNTSSGNVLQAAGSTLLNTIQLMDAAARTLTLGGGNTLQVGGILRGNAAGSVTIGDVVNSGALSAGTAAGDDLVFTNGNAAGSLAVNSVIANNAGGAVDVVINGSAAATTVLAGANTTTGSIAVQNGILRATNNSALGTTAGGVTVSDGTALELSGGITIGDEALSIIGTGVGSNGALRNQAGTNTYGGLVTLVATAEIQADAGTTLIFDRPGTATAVTTAFPITLDVAGTMTFNDALVTTGSANPTITKSGTGALNFNATNTFAGTGTFTVGAGTVRISDGGALGGTTAGTSISANAALELIGGIATNEAITLNNTTGISTNGAIRNISGSNTITGQVTIDNGAGRIQADAGLLTLAGGVRGDPDSTTVRALTISGSGNTSITGNIVVGGASGGHISLTKIGAGTLILSGTNASTSTTAVTGGTLIVTNAAGLGAGAVTVNGGGLNYFAATDAPLAVAGTLGITGGASTVIGGSIGSTTPSAQINVTGAATISNAAHRVNIYGVPGTTPTTGTYTLIQGGAGSSLNPTTAPTLGTVFNNTNFTVGAFTRSATALQVDITAQTALAAAFWTGGLAGATNVWAASNGTTASNWVTSAGGGATALIPGSGADLTISASTVVTAPTATVLGSNMSIRTLTIADTVNGLGLNADGNTLTITNAGGITMNASVPASTIAANVALGTSQTWANDSTNALTVNGVVSGASQLTKAGTGTLTLGGVNTYTGGTVLSAGTIITSSTQALGAAANTLNLAGGTLNLATNNSIAANVTTVSGNATIVSNRATADAGITHTLGTLSIGANTLTVNAGANVTSGTAGLAFGATTFTGAPTFDVGTGANLTLPAITNASNFATTKQGAGILTIAGANASTGTLAVNAGTVTVNGSGRWTGDITVASGASLQNTGAGTNSLVGTVTVQSGGVFDNQQTGAETIAAFNLEGTGSGGTGAWVNNAAGTTAGTLTSTAGITLTGNASVGGAGSIATASAITGAFEMTKVGNGSLTLGAAASTGWTGGLNINSGTVTGGNNANTFGADTNVITLGASSGSANATLRAVNSFTYLQPIVVASGNTGIASIIAGTSTGNVVFGGGITLNTHDVVLGKTGTTGASQFTGGITGTGNITINNTATTGTITLATGAVNPVGSITHTSSATGTTTISADIGSNVTGVTQSSASSVLTLSGANIAFNGPLTVSAGTLNLTGGATTGPTVTALTVAAGSTLNLNNTAGQHFNLGGGALSLGVGTGTSTLNMELGSTSNYDRISSSAAATTANNVVLNLLGITGFGAGTYDLITAGSGLSGATYSIGSLAGALGGFSLGLNTSANLVQLTSTLNTGAYYWNGGINTSWSGLSGLNTNFANNLAGTVNANGIPGLNNSVVFSTSAQTGATLSTTLDTPISIRDLTFNNQLGSGPLASIAIAPGTSGTLTITPTASAAGINVQTGAPATITLSAPVILGASQTWTVVDAATNLASSGGITGTANFIKEGDGIVTLSGTNTYVGTTTVNDGVLQAGATNGFNQTSAHTVNTGATLRLNNFAATVGSLAGAGTVDNLNGTAGRVLTTGGDNTSTTFSGVLQNGGSFNLGLAKVGTGMMTLTGNNTMSGNYTVNGGRLAVTTGTTNNGTGQFTVGSAATTRGMLLIGSGATINTTDMDFGSNATNAAGAGYQTAGTVTLTSADANGLFGLGNANTGYGYYEISGGSVSMNRLTLSNTATTGTGIFRQTGGTVNIGVWTTVGHGSGSALLDIEGGTYNSGTNFAMGANDAGAFSVTNVRGTGTLVAANGSTLLTNRGDNAARDNMVNVLNLLTGGTIRTASGGINNGTTSGATNNFVHVNLNGGTIITNQATTNLININNTNTTLTANSGAFMYSGGLTVDTNGLNSTIPSPLQAPVGVGVQGIAVSTEGTGYIGAPIVRITGGSGAGATAVANMVDDGSGNGTFKVGSITITNPGTGYLNTDVLTVSFVDNASVYTTQATLGAVTFNGGNTSGGLTKNGAGILTLSGVNTYTGGTTINAGTVALGVANALADTGNVTIAGGALNVATFNDTVATVSLQSGAITGTTGILTSTANYDLRSGSVSAILAGGVGLDKTTSGTVTLSGANTYSGVTNVTAGTLAFSAANNLGNASPSNTITLNGGTLNYTGSSSANLAANQVMTIGSSGGTLNVSDIGGTLNLLGGITTSSAANLTKTGPGTVFVTGSTNLNGGHVTVSAGVLNAGFTASGIGAIDVASGATLNLYDGDTTTMAISSYTPPLGVLTSGLILANGSSLGFDLDAPGVNDILNLTGTASVTSTSTVSLNFNNLGGLAVGDYDLINVTAGTLTATNYILGIAPSGLNYNFSTINSNQTLRLTTSTLNLVYWRGDVDGSWSTNTAGDTNWASNLAGTTDLGVLPIATDTLVFSATNATGPTITTTLDGDFTADSLQFTANPSGVTSVAVNQGSSGTLTLKPASANNGISVATNAGAITVAAPVTTGAVQSWEVIGGGANGSSLTVSGLVTMNHLINKTGAGTLTLSGSNTGAGGVNLAAGSLVIANNNALGTGTFTIGAGTTINTGAGAITNAGNNVQNWDGNFTFTGTNALSLGTGAVTLADNVIATVSAQTLTIGGAIGDGASTFGLTKAGAGTLTLSGANTYGGLTSLTAGTLNLNGSNTGAAGGVTMAASTNLNIGHANALGTGAFTINGGTIDNTSGAPLTLGLGVAQNWNGNFTFTGTNNLDTGSGAVTLGANTQITTNAGTLTVSGIIDDGANTFGITKTGTGTLVLSGLSTTASSNYGGTTTLNAGITSIANAAALTGGLTFGAATSNTTATTLNLTNGATFAGNVLVQNRTTTDNIINISSGQTLTLNGNLTVGAADPGAVGVSSLLTMNGGGNLAVSTAAGGLFQVGGSTSGTNSLNSVLDLTGLATASINVSNTGTVRVNQPNGTNLNGNRASLLLPTPTVALNTPVTTITAANLNIGDNGGNNGAAGQVNTVTLGTGLTTLNVNTINIGTGGRDMGQLNFASGNGTLIVRAADGVGRAAVNIGTGAANTGVASGTGVTNNMTLSGHSSDLLISTLTIGGQNRNTNRSDTLSFDTGILDATTVLVGDNGGTANTTAANNTWTSTLNIGGGTTTIGTGGLDIARGDTAVTGTDVIEGTVNISGGTVSIANSTGLAAAVRLGHNTIATGLTTTGALNITGGAVTVSGHIIKGSTTGTGSATLTLNGGSLNMSGNNIGAASPTVTFNAQSGTLQNVAQINGGAGLTKTTAGTLILEGTNTYTGGTTISAGTVQVGGGTLGTGSVTGTLGSGDISNSGTLTINRSNSYTLANNISGAGAFIQAGLGTTILGGTNTYTGKTTISTGKLSIDSEARLGDNPGTSTGDQLTLAGGTLQTTANLTIDDSNRGITVSAASSIEVNSGTTATISSTILGSASLSKEGAGTLIFTAVQTGHTGTVTVNGGTLAGLGGTGGDLVVASSGTLSPGITGTPGAFTVTGSLTVSTGGTLATQIGGATTNAAAAVLAELNANGNLLGLIGSVPSAWENYLNGTTAHSHTLVGGTASAPAITGTVALLGGYSPVYGDVFDILDWGFSGAMTSTPSAFDFGGITLGSGLAFNTELFASNGIIVVVPEPSRALFLMLGLFGLMLRRRRK